VIERERITEEFLTLARISSPSRREARMAERLVPALESLGARVEVDEAGRQIGGDVGNVLGRLPGTVPGAPALLLCAHMDTVVPCDVVRPVMDGTVIRTDGTSVLGGDDKAAIVAILEALRVVRERGVAHGPIEVLFTISEESGLLGAKHFDTSRLMARRGLVLDCDGVDELITRAPAAASFRATVHGLEAHAGMFPEQGISAITVAAEAVAAMRLGRVDEETTANLGLIEGGLATNIVPNRVTVRGEARSRDVAKLEAQTEHMRRCLEEAAARHAVTIDGREHRARVETRIERSYERLAVADDAAIVDLVRAAAGRLGRRLRTRATGGGSDANVFAGRGLEMANLGCGMNAIHTVHEWVDVRDLVATAELVVAVIEEHGGLRAPPMPLYARPAPA
jgi:tripeptide aminopeptidase